MTDLKLTGGDPALYDPLIDVVAAVKRRTAIKNVEVISRHPRIGELATGLAAAGVDRFNVSLDTLSPELHRRICGVDDLPRLLDAIMTLVGTGVPVKLNTVVMAGINDTEIMSLISFAETAGIRSLKLLDVIEDLDLGKEFHLTRLRKETGASTLSDLYRPLADISGRLSAMAVKVEVQTQGDLGHPMQVFSLAGGLQVIVKDSKAGAWYGEICRGCRFFPCHDALMALRLTPDLRAQFCLLRDDITIDIAPIVRDKNQSLLRDELARICNEYDRAQFFTPVTLAAVAPALLTK
jgi:cyclic pyranopterin phosphate synthase